MSRRSLGEVEDDALAHERGGNFFERAGEPGRFEDVPFEEAAIEIDRLRILALHADGAFKPPIGRVQPMGEMLVEKSKALRLDGAAKLALAEDAHMAARLVVIVVGEGPADALRPVARNADGESTSRF